MTLPIFHFPDPVDDSFITLNEETSKHVIQVLRMKKGAKLNLADGRGGLYHTAIVDDHKKRCTVNIMQSEFHESDKKRISIGISLLKNSSRFEWFLEKATEIGVFEIYPLLCERTERQHLRWDRMNNILISAMLQSQQYWLPILHHANTFESFVSSSNYEKKFIAHCLEGQKQNISDLKQSTSSQILIGPEGDFTKDEISLANDHSFIPVSLGKTRLRTETAGVVAAVLLAAL